MPKNIKGHRKRASVVVIDKKNRSFLMMYRRTKSKKDSFVEKFVVPGGGLNKDETIKQAAIREIKEETTLDVTIDHKMATIKYPNCDDYVFVATKFSGESKLAGEELERCNKDNYYEPRWISINDIDNLKPPIHPRSLVRLIKKEF